MSGIDKSRVTVNKWFAREEGESVLNGHRVSFVEIENILELDHSYGCTTSEYTKSH